MEDPKLVLAYPAWWTYMNVIDEGQTMLSYREFTRERLDFALNVLETKKQELIVPRGRRNRFRIAELDELMGDLTLTYTHATDSEEKKHLRHLAILTHQGFRCLTDDDDNEDNSYIETQIRTIVEASNGVVLNRRVDCSEHFADRKFIQFVLYQLKDTLSIAMLSMYNKCLKRKKSHTLVHSLRSINAIQLAMELGYPNAGTTSLDLEVDEETLNTIMHVNCHNLHVIRYLVEQLHYGHLLTVRNREGNTPLSLFLITVEIEVDETYAQDLVMYMIKHGSSLVVENDEAVTAMDLVACRFPRIKQRIEQENLLQLARPQKREFPTDILKRINEFL
jgi:hypothetical protein